MKKTVMYCRLLTAFLSLAIAAGLSSCKKDNDKTTQSGGGTSSQSVVMLKGASQ